MDQRPSYGSPRGFHLFFEELTLDLLEFAEWDFKLSLPDKDGVSEREYLEQVEKQAGHTPTPLQGPEFPELLGSVWSFFLELHGSRGQGYNGPLPLTYTEISAWQSLTGNTLSSWEVDVIKKLDRTYVRIINDRPS